MLFQNLMGTITGLFGSLVGTSVGGYVMDRYGSVVLYRGAAFVILVAFMVYGSLVLLEQGFDPILPRLLSRKIQGMDLQEEINCEDGPARDDQCKLGLPLEEAPETGRETRRAVYSPVIGSADVHACARNIEA